MKIGELATQSGFTVETLRYYEREGLLPPALRDSNNNYRYYQQQHLDAALFIRRCRALDMAHEEIRTLLQARDEPDGDCSRVNQLIDEHLLHVQRRIDELRTLEQQLLTLQDHCHTRSTARDCGILRRLEAPQSEPQPLNETHLIGVHRR